MAATNKKQGRPTQEHLPFTAVFENTLVLNNGEFRQIVMVSSINFGLKSEEEQTAILYAYQGFLNSLPFPVQILIRSRQIDLGEYLARLKKNMFQQSNELIRYQTQEYVDFISRLISVANIMDKKFFVVVPYLRANLKTGIFAPKHPHLQVSLQEFEKIKLELQKRVEVVQQGLASLGLQSALLNTEQVIELLYASYNITESMRQKLQNTEELAKTTVEQKTAGGTPAASPRQVGVNVPIAGQAPVDGLVNNPTPSRIIPGATPQAAPAAANQVSSVGHGVSTVPNQSSTSRRI